LTHRVSGEQIDVDFSADHAEGFDFYFYLNYLRSLREPPPPERRLIELHHSLDALRLAFDELCHDGLLTTDASCRAPRLTPESLGHLDQIEVFCTRWADPAQRLWLAGRVGDWLAFRDALPETDASLRFLAGERADALCRDRRTSLVARFEEEPRL